MLDKPIWVAGCMTGTSMDGVDVAMVLTDGVAIYDLGDSAFRPFSDTERALIQVAQGQWHGDVGVKTAANLIEDAHAEVLANFRTADLIGFHGQTLAHDPAKGRTHQAGDGASLARLTGKPVVWDFRTNDVSLGGQGAPLAPIYHWALTRWSGVSEPVAVLNLGGVGNITWVDPNASEDALVAFDTGPANAPLDDFIMRRTGARYDKDGILAAGGTVHQGIVDEILADPFFATPSPKSLDRNSFAKLDEMVENLSTADGAATLTAVMTASVIKGLDLLPDVPSQIWVSGGGRKNPAVMQMLTDQQDAPVLDIDTIGVDGDMVEAQAFAYLAARVKAGLPTSFPGTTGVAMSVGGGVVSAPT